VSVTDELAGEDILTQRIAIPEHVVHRSFVQETVVLNLSTGRYHGVNRTGGRILELLAEDSRAAEAARRLALEARRDEEETAREVAAFLQDMLSRGLVELVPGGD
jgi:Coenzyme PQQ synthesis protein D (PqqD)